VNADFVIIPIIYANKLPTNHITPFTSDEIKDCNIKNVDIIIGDKNEKNCNIFGKSSDNAIFNII